MSKQCPGCGAIFQHDDPNKPGYLPLDRKRTDGPPVCRRCFRLRHYGKAEGGPPPAGKVNALIRRALDNATAAVLLIDLGDFEGGMPPAGLLPPDLPLILAVNKIDLLPPKAVMSEVLDWAGARWRAAGRGPAARSVKAVSALRGIGTSSLAAEMRRLAGDGRAVLLGATSTGKSTLIRRLLAGMDAREPTVSRLPGTTQGVTDWRLGRGNLDVRDTPGFVPGDRILDKLCPDCAAQLVPERALAGKLYDLESGRAVVLAGLAAFILDGPEPRTFLCYAADSVNIHRTTADKAEELLETKPDWLLPWICGQCRANAGLSLRTEQFDLAPGQDLAVAGLGWISLRGGPAKIRVMLPEGVRVVKREGMFGRKDR